MCALMMCVMGSLLLGGVVRYLDFEVCVTEFWAAYFQSVAAAFRDGWVEGAGGMAPLYPTTILCTETKAHFIVELAGHQRSFDGIKLKRHRTTSIDRYLGQGEDEKPGVFNFSGCSNTLSGAFLRHEDHEEKLLAAFLT
jgi:hypothetical protein